MYKKLKYSIKVNRGFYTETDIDYTLTTISVGMIPEYKIKIPKDRSEVIESTENYIRLLVDFDVLNPYVHTNKLFKGVSDIKLA